MQTKTAVRPVNTERAGERSQLAAWFWSSALVVVLWSVSYLIRQAYTATDGVVTDALPLSPIGDFALEGMLLALGWLTILAAACLAILTGVARFEER